MRKPTNRKPLDGVDVGHLRALLEHPGWAIVAAELEWEDGDTCEAMRNCAPSDLGRLQGASQKLRKAENIPASLIAAWEAEQAKAGRK